jgi:alanine racemase
MTLTSRIVAGEGRADRRRRRLRREVQCGGSHDDRDRAGRATPTAWTCGSPGRGSVLIRGRRAPIVGSVCMDMLIADVTGLDVSPGDEVVIIGSQGDDRIDVREMAAQIGTIPYEILCRIGSRIERLYR